MTSLVPRTKGPGTVVAFQMNRVLGSCLRVLA